MKHKFRCWDGSEYYRPLIDEHGVYRDFRDCEYGETSDHDLHIFSGLYDASGVEIYEGDRITHDRDTGTVYFEKGAFRVKWDEPVTWDKRSLLYYVNKQCKVEAPL